ncbi:MAG: hypothetical protein B6D41_00890 [Chloroflexi bacterium UTCFX4]|jgi:hypothetical protein|nr:MAG: hypothetical protein B6D41_00890 [Chloroflexi bacterium UTCFX4]
MNQPRQTHLTGAMDSRTLACINDALETLVPNGQSFSIENWTQRLESFLFKKIQFVEMPLPKGFFGARIILLPTADAREPRPVEIVITSRGLIPLMQDHVRAHELAHITLGHQTVMLTPQELLDLKGDISAIRNCPGATCRAVELERLSESVLERDIMAETLARLAEQRYIEHHVRTRAQGVSSDAATDRMIMSLMGH